MIKIENFSKSYSSKKEAFAVKDLDLTVENGAVTGLLGANGSGKTTLIKAICGFHYPDSGKILVSDFDGKIYDISKEPQMAMRLIGYVPEISSLPEDMRVKDFLEAAYFLHGGCGETVPAPQAPAAPTAHAKQALSKVAETCGLSDFINKKIKTLSKGQKQRVSFAQAIIFDPPNLVLDEPVSGLDPLQIIEMRKLIQKFAQDKKRTRAVLMSTHILQESKLCGQIYIMKGGRLIEKGSEEEITRRLSAKDLEEAFYKLSTSDSGE